MTEPYKGWTIRVLKSDGNPNFYYAQRDNGLIIERDESPYFEHPLNLSKWIDEQPELEGDK